MKNDMKLKFKIFLIIGIIIGSINAFGQEYTDEQIGFDREELRKEMTSGGFMPKEFVEKQLDELRATMVKRYEMGFDAWLESTKPKYDIPRSRLSRSAPEDYNSFETCESFTFDEGSPLNGWRLWANPLTADSNNIHLGDYGYIFSEENGNYTDITDNSYSYYLDDRSPKSNRFHVFKSNDFDGSDHVESSTNPSEPYASKLGTSNSTNVIRVGNRAAGIRKDMITKSFTLKSLDDFIMYDYAIVLNDPVSGHNNIKPYFAINMKVGNSIKECSIVKYEANSVIPGFNPYNNDPYHSDYNIKIKPWATNIIKPSDFGAVVNDQITIEVTASDCGAAGHFGYGYFDIRCISEEDLIVLKKDDLCAKENLTITTPLNPLNILDSEGELDSNYFYKWSIKDENGTEVFSDDSSTNTLNYSFNSTGVFTIELDVPYFTTSSSSTCDVVSTLKRKVRVYNCDPCHDCVSFDLQEGKKYLVTGWAKVGNSLNPSHLQYQDAAIQISCTDLNDNIVPDGLIEFTGSGEIIDGWQRIIGEFSVPPDTTFFNLLLTNTGSNAVYFDDIRILPSDANMKSFVYDQETQRLMSELDENNYSTFYEYDQEGGLIRIKKETERGIYTIQETRSFTQKAQYIHE